MKLKLDRTDPKLFVVSLVAGEIITRRGEIGPLGRLWVRVRGKIGGSAAAPRQQLREKSNGS